MCSQSKDHEDQKLETKTKLLARSEGKMLKLEKLSSEESYVCLASTKKKKKKNVILLLSTLQLGLLHTHSRSNHIQGILQFLFKRRSDSMYSEFAPDLGIDEFKYKTRYE